MRGHPGHILVVPLERNGTKTTGACILLLSPCIIASPIVWATQLREVVVTRHGGKRSAEPILCTNYISYRRGSMSLTAVPLTAFWSTQNLP